MAAAIQQNNIIWSFTTNDWIMVRSPTKVTPDSVPSVSATTAASSFTDQVVRELFPLPQDDGNDSERQRLGESLHIEVDSESMFGSDISVASEGTYVSTDDERQHRTGQLEYRDGESPVDDSQIKMFPGCHGTIDLPPNFASTMFNIFDSSHKKSTQDDGKSAGNSVNDAVTEVASNIDHSILQWERKIDSLEREIATLKGIIKSDSVTILSLKTALSEYQEREIPSKRDLILEQEIELSTQQVKEYEETIQHLHDEIEVLSKHEDNKDNESIEAQLQLQNELFASQIIETETEIRQTQDIMSQILEENAKLRRELEELRSQPIPQLESQGIEISDSNVVLHTELLHVQNWMKDIEQKLESGFYCKCTLDRRGPSNVIVDSHVVYPENLEQLFDSDDDDEIDENKPVDELSGPDIEVKIDGTIITAATGTETRTVAADEKLRSNNTSKCNEDEPFNDRCMQTLEVVYTDCNFCDCLRTKSITNETNL